MKALQALVSASLALAAAGCAANIPAFEGSHAAAATEDQRDPLLPDLGNDGYDARSYDLAFNVEPASRMVEGTATMTATADESLARFDMDFAGGKVHSVSVNARPARFQVENQKLKVVPRDEVRRGAFRVTVNYTADREAKVSSKVDPSAGWGNEEDGGFAWWSQPDRAHLFFPCNDDVADKAAFTYRVTVPDGWNAIANGTRVYRRSADGRTVYAYSSEHPVAPQLTQLAVGRFDIVTGRGPHGLPLRSAVPAGTDTTNVRRLPEFLTWLENKIGRRYPFETAGVLAVKGGVPEQTFALETQTLPVFPVSGLQDADAVVHELAHQWFGDSAGIKTWNDIWLSEGFATYMSVMWTAEHSDKSLNKAMHMVYKGDQKMRDMGITPAEPRK